MTKTEYGFNQITNKAILAFAGLLTAVLSGQLFAESELLYSNDLGTDIQVEAWRGSGSFDIERPPTVDDYTDLDGDDLVGNWVYPGGWNRAVAYKSYYAPEFMTVSNPRFTSLASGYYSSHRSHANIGLSKDEDRWDSGEWIHDGVRENAHRTEPIELEVAGSGPEWQNLTGFELYVRLENRSGTDPGHSGHPRAGQLQIEGELNPAEIGERTNILLNDMGTQEQRDAWTIEGGTPEFIEDPSRDIDGDNLAQYVRHRGDDGSRSTMTIQIDAPEGKYFKNPVAEAEGIWSDSYWNWTYLRLSLDGENFDVEASTPENTYNDWYDMITDATGEPGYDQPLSSLWLEVEMHRQGGHDSYEPGFRNLTVTGTVIPEPSTLVLLGLAGLLLLKRRRI